MKNFRMIEQNVDVSELLEELLANPTDWDIMDTLPWNPKEIEALGETKHINPVGGWNSRGVGNHVPKLRECHFYTRFYVFPHYPKNMAWIESRFPEGRVGRVFFIKLPPGNRVNPHYDRGDYYKVRDRHHLVLSGTYKYTVGDEEIVAKPGDFFWFDNKKVHSSEVVGDEDRIILLIDVAKSGYYVENTNVLTAPVLATQMDPHPRTVLDDWPGTKVLVGTGNTYN